MRIILALSLLLNVAAAVVLFAAVNHLGGWSYLSYRMQNDESALYEHRRALFEDLPVHEGAWIFLGDSHIEQAEWHELVGGQSLNRGIVGDYVEGVTARLPEINRHKPTKIFLEVGVNDLFFGKSADEVKAAYQNLVQSIRRDNPQAALFLCSVLPVNNAVRNTKLSNDAVRELNERIQGISGAFAIPYVDVYAQVIDGDGNLSARLTSDGVHLNAQGYLIWKKAIEAYTE